MLSKEKFNKFIDEINKAIQQYEVWITTNNEFAKHEVKWNRTKKKITYTPCPLMQITGDTYENEVVTETVNKYKNFFPIIIPTLQQGWVLTVAKLFDTNYTKDGKKKTHTSISLEYILEKINDLSFSNIIESEKIEHEQLLSSLKTIRDIIIAHNDARFAKYQKKQIEAGIEKLFMWLARIVNRIQENYSHLRECRQINVSHLQALSQSGVEEVFNDLS